MTNGENGVALRPDPEEPPRDKLLEDEEERQLPKEQQIAAAYLAAGMTNVECAGKLGVSESTVKRWRRDRLFQLHVQDIRDGLLDVAQARVLVTLPKAITKINVLIDHPNPLVSLRASGEARQYFEAMLAKHAPTVAVGVSQNVTVEDKRLALDLGNPKSVLLFHELLRASMNGSVEGSERSSKPDTNPSQGKNGTPVNGEAAHG